MAVCSTKPTCRHSYQPSASYFPLQYLHILSTTSKGCKNEQQRQQSENSVETENHGIPFDETPSSIEWADLELWDTERRWRSNGTTYQLAPEVDESSAYG
jgi:hypothetical protein